MPEVSVVVPIFNGVSHLEAFFESLAAALPPRSQVVIVDDASTEPVLESVPPLPRADSVVPIRNEANVGMAAAVNRGFAVATGDIVIQLNSDLVLDGDCISAMVEFIETHQGDVGIVGSKLIYPTSGRTQSVGMAFGLHSKRHVFRHLPHDHPLCRDSRNLQIVTGATVAMTRRVLAALGPLDEELYNHNLDLDHCLRAVGLGLRNYMCARSVAYHWRNQSGTIRYARVASAEAAFWAKWGRTYQVDLAPFVDEALDHAISAWPRLEATPFTILDLSRGADRAVVLKRVLARWPGASGRILHFRQMHNAAPRLWLPLVLPHRLMDARTPFLYLLDDHQELGENALWFERRRRLVAEELVVDLSGSVLTTSELQAFAGQCGEGQYNT